MDKFFFFLNAWVEKFRTKFKLLPTSSELKCSNNQRGNVVSIRFFNMIFDIVECILTLRKIFHIVSVSSLNKDPN